MIHFLTFSVRQALEGLWRNRVMSLAATVTMVLMLVLLVEPGHRALGHAGRALVHRDRRSRSGPSSPRASPRSAWTRSSAELAALPEVASVELRQQGPGARRVPAAARARRASRTSPTYVGSTRSRRSSSVKLVDPRQASRSGARPRLPRRGSVVGQDVDRPAEGHRPARERHRDCCAPIGVVGARAGRADGAAHRRQLHPHGGDVARPGDRDHAPRGRLRPVRALAVHRRGPARRTARRRS